jgi:hypothetical protein
MAKQNITISLDSEVAKKLRMDSIDKYGNARSLSRLIEDLATGAAESKPLKACSVLGNRTERSFKMEAEFKKAVEDITAQLSKIKLTYGIYGDHYEANGVELYFLLKEALELRINKEADVINECWTCHGLNGPLPKYPDAGRNFDIYSMMDSELR